ncbi:MAG: hypothetical protein H6841_02600 [Planctomycetes bacterium]|nr:hypothetical protein [Planctomycetota bacterium]
MRTLLSLLAFSSALTLVGVAYGGLVVLQSGQVDASNEPAVSKNNCGAEEVKQQYLVLRVTCDDSTVQKRTTSLFLYPLGNGAASVDSVLDEGMYFRSATRMLAYAKERGVEAQLVYDATQQLVDGPAPFENLPESDRIVNDREIVVSPDLAVPAETWGHQIARLKYGKGGFVFVGPSGVSTDEAWVLGGGYYVRDYQDYVDVYNKHHKEPILEVTVAGRVLK